MIGRPWLDHQQFSDPALFTPKQAMTISTTTFPIWLWADFPDRVDFGLWWGWGFKIRPAEVTREIKCKTKLLFFSLSIRGIEPSIKSKSFVLQIITNIFSNKLQTFFLCSKTSLVKRVYKTGFSWFCESSEFDRTEFKLGRSWGLEY